MDVGINIGDLVSLRIDSEDKKQFSIGIVVDKKILSKNQDFPNIFSEQEVNIILKEMPELINKPMFLVLWSKVRPTPSLLSGLHRQPIWMFGSELIILNKA